MGFFDKLFKAKSKADQPQLLQHKEEWDFYFSNVNDVLGSIFVDLGLSKIAPLKDKPNLQALVGVVTNKRVQRPYCDL
jgi:hypothetical protein